VYLNSISLIMNRTRGPIPDRILSDYIHLILEVEKLNSEELSRALLNKNIFTNLA
jgi:hypothetical protein